MSTLELPPRRGTLPPLGQDESLSTSIDHTPRKKKRKPSVAGENGGTDTDRSTPSRKMPTRPQPPGSARSSDRETLDTGRLRDVTPRPGPKPKVTGAIDIEDEQTPRPKKRKPKPKSSESQEELVEHGQPIATDRTDRSDRPKKKKKKKQSVPMVTGVGLEAELDELEDDVVGDDNESFEENHYGTPAVMKSVPINKVFIEKKTGFKTANKDKIARKRANQLRQNMVQAEPQQMTSTIQFAISSQRVFKHIVLFLQGLLAGICLWQVVVVYVIAGTQSYLVLMETYTALALPVQCMYYFLLALSTVAVFDKNDIARPNKKFVIRSATMQTTAIACFFYLAGLIFNVGIAHIDDKISLYRTQPELWPDDEERDAELKRWVTLNLVRGLMPILGWLVISISPTTDRLIENLEKADENIIEGLESPLGEETETRSPGVNGAVSLA